MPDSGRIATFWCWQLMIMGILLSGHNKKPSEGSYQKLKSKRREVIVANGQSGSLEVEHASAGRWWSNPPFCCAPFSCPDIESDEDRQYRNASIVNAKAAGPDDSNFGTGDRHSKTRQKVETFKSSREIIESNAKLDYLPARTSLFSAFLSDPGHTMCNSLPHANTIISDATS